MNALIQNLEMISKQTAGAAQAKEILSTIGAAKKAAHDLKQDQLLAELTTWENKIDVILKEPAGRRGMAKHAQFWAEKIKNGR